MTIDGAAEASRAASAGRAPVDPLYTGRRFTLGTLLLIGRNQGLASNVSQAWQAVLPTESFEPMTGLETPPHIPNDFRTLLSGMGVLHPTVMRPLSFGLARRLNVLVPPLRGVVEIPAPARYPFDQYIQKGKSPALPGFLMHRSGSIALGRRGRRLPLRPAACRRRCCSGWRWE
jgi:hypothetical protein